MVREIVRLKHKKHIKNWTMTQMWEHLFFAHWPVSTEMIRNLVPRQLEIDTFGGMAWIGIIPFLMNGFKLKYTPTSYPFAFPEINVRTYVKANGSPAIYFITLDAADPFVVNVAKRWYHLPYFHGEMSLRRKGRAFLFQSRRKKPAKPVATFQGEFYPISDGFIPREGSIEHWLAERYVYFTKCPLLNKVYGGEVYHEPWTLQKARAQIHVNTMGHAYDLELPNPPQYMHYARGVEAQIGRVGELISCKSSGLYPSL